MFTYLQRGEWGRRTRAWQSILIVLALSFRIGRHSCVQLAWSSRSGSDIDVWIRYGNLGGLSTRSTRQAGLRLVARGRGFRGWKRERNSEQKANESQAAVDEKKTLFVANLGVSDRVNNRLEARRVEAVARSRGADLPDRVQGSNVYKLRRSYINYTISD